VRKMPMIVCLALVVLTTGLFVRSGWVQGIDIGVTSKQASE
jgi:hypothetical protein